jgi:hypothetical protein
MVVYSLENSEKERERERERENHMGDLFNI